MCKAEKKQSNKCNCLDKCSLVNFWILIVILLGIIVSILWGMFYTINKIQALSVNLFTELTINVINNPIDGSIELNNEAPAFWIVLIIGAISVCATAFIICKIISSLRDLIENEQINRRYNH